MQSVLLVLAAINLLVCLYVGTQFFIGSRSLRNLADIAPLPMEQLPSTSIVVAARNEERNIEPALQSLLQLDYEPLEVLVVEDRSTDRTGEILDRMATLDSRLRILHITELPTGWLGKNHALESGAAKATGELILFTDADVVMERTVLRRAVAFLRERELDHLTLFFRIDMPNWLLESFVVTFSMYFFAYFKPWRVRDPNSAAHVGAGGFNLLRANAYRRMGGHRPIAMRPDDDVKLGKLVKKYGLRSDVILAPDLVSVPWYASLGELIRGLEKNAFAGVDYNVPLVIGSSLVALTFHVFPFLAVFFTTGLTRWLFAADVALLLIMAGRAARNGRLRVSAALGFPLAALLFVFIQWRTMVLNLWHGGIRWRDTFYSLAELRANKV